MAIKISKLVGQIGLSGSAAVVIQGSTFLLVLILSNVLGPAGLALYAVTQNTVTTTSSLAQAGLGISASTYIARYQLRDAILMRQILRFCLGATVILGCAIAVVIAFSSELIAANIYGNGDLSIMILIAAGVLPFAAIVLTQVGILNGLALYKPQLWAAIASSAFLLLAAGGGALLGGAIGAALGFAAATVLRATIFHWQISKQVPRLFFSESNFRGAWLRIRSFAIPAGLAGLTLTPSTWIANAILVNFDGLKELGIFLAALSIRSVVSFVPQQIGITFLPYLLRLEGNAHDNETRYFTRILVLMVGTALTVSFPIAMFGPEILGLFGSEFKAAAAMLNCLLLAVVIESASLAFSNRYAARERMWSVLLLYTFPKDIFLVVLAFFLIPEWSGLGLAIAYLLSALYGLLSYVIIAKTVHWHPRQRL